MSKLVSEKDLKNEGKKGIPYSEPGKTPSRGSWRTFVPVIDQKKCIKCHLCWLHCPDTAIEIRKDGFVECNLSECKGCGLCAAICPVKAIKMEREKR